jgi:hypothetical protein
MKYTPSQIEMLFKKIVGRVAEGTPLRQVLQSTDMPGVGTFYDWLDKDESKAERYARAKQLAAELLFDELDEIARTPIESETIDDGPNGVRRITSDNVQRSRLMVDVIKWRLAKESPKKYGDKLDVTSDNKAIALPPIIGMVIKNETTEQQDEPQQPNGYDYEQDDLF